MPKKLVKKHTADEYLFNPIQEMIEDANLEDFPGCCGVTVLQNFPDGTQCQYLANEANDIEEINAKVSKYDRDSVPNSVSRAEIREQLFREAPMILATTIPSQRYANRVLPLLGFISQTIFKGRGKNLITLWTLKKS